MAVGDSTVSGTDAATIDVGLGGSSDAGAAYAGESLPVKLVA